MHDLITKGGFIMWPLIFCSIISITIIIERLFFWLITSKNQNNAAIDAIFDKTNEGDFDGAIEAGNNEKCAICRILISGLKHREYGLEECLSSAASCEIKKMKRGLAILDTIITVSPLLGILGTVSGIISSFDLLGEMGIQDPQSVTGGIAQALITTAAGLTVAIITLIPYNYFVSKVENFAHSASKICTHYCVSVKKGEELIAKKTN